MPTSRWSSRALVVYVLSFLLLAISLVLSAALHTASASPPPSAPKTKALPSAPNDASCWQVVASPNPPTSTSQLYGVAAAGPDDLWAVGSNMGVVTSTLIEHWNGTNWSIVSAPSPGTWSELYGVDALAPNDAWAVGISSGHPLALHWDDTGWTVVPVSVFGDYAVLKGVTAISANDAWAVGSWFSNNEGGSLVLHGDGMQWQSVSVPGPYSPRLQAVDAVASDDVWAVGEWGILHWNGTVWSDSTLPQESGCAVPITLYGVDAHASNDVWSVGYCPGRQGGTSFAWILHWDGAQWSAYSPNLNYAQVPVLTSVSAIAPNDVWTVGYRNAPFPPGGPRESIVLHWDGLAWTQVSIPQHGGSNNLLYGVAVLAHDNAWAVGTFGDVSSGSGQTLIQHYGPCPPPCPGERFTDVCPTDYFYTATLALADDAILSGYGTSPPCPNSLWIPCFKPYNSITRGQIAKVVSLAAGFNEPVSGQTFYDVPPGSTFHEYVERMASRGIMQGYPFGTGNCPQQNLPCFLLNRLATRGQLSKIVALAFQFAEPVSGQTFEDVAPGSTFYEYIQRIAARSIISGYPCGGATEPCIPPGNLPYFRPNNNVTRGQTAKIVQLARTQPTPTITPTPTVSSQPTATSTTTPDITSTPILTATPTETVPAR